MNGRTFYLYLLALLFGTTVTELIPASSQVRSLASHARYRSQVAGQSQVEALVETCTGSKVCLLCRVCLRGLRLKGRCRKSTLVIGDTAVTVQDE